MVDVDNKDQFLTKIWNVDLEYINTNYKQILNTNTNYEQVISCVHVTAYLG